MKAKITIEQYENGISIKWNDVEDKIEPSAIVVLDSNINERIGEMIWEDCRQVMDLHLCNSVKMVVEYQPIKEE